MADGEDGGERTEKATDKRRRMAREEGQAARSMEVNSVVVLLAGLGTTWAAIGWIGEQMMRASRHFFGNAGQIPLESPSEGLAQLGIALEQTALATAPVLLATFVLGTAIAFGQVGWNFSTKAMQFKVSKLNPLEGLKQKFFSKQTWFELAKNLIKVVLLGVVAGLTIRDLLPKVVGLAGLPVVPGWEESMSLIIGLLLRLLAVMFVLALIDLWFQRYRHEESIKMTKEEVKREHKDAEGDPKIKARIRSMMMEKFRQMMMENVKTADVVVTNPTHYSVALRYRPDEGAPKLVAKGQGHLALRLREIARENGVPVMENPPLARALYRTVEVGQFVPGDLFEGVAQVLAAVYRADRKRAQAAGM